MAVSIQDIQNWLAANPTASDKDIATVMDQYGVTPAQMAQATGAVSYTHLTLPTKA